MKGLSGLVLFPFYAPPMTINFILKETQILVLQHLANVQQVRPLIQTILLDLELGALSLVYGPLPAESNSLP